MSDSSGRIVKSYEQELKRLRDLITEMGGIVENQVALAAQALALKDSEAATRVVQDDPRVGAASADGDRPAADRGLPEDHRRPRADR